MKSSTGKFVLIGCSGIGLIVLLTAGGILWLLFSAVESVNNNMTGGYKISGGKVDFYRGLSGFGAPQSWEITEADAATFKVLDDGYATDKNHAYVDGYLIPQSEGATFKIIRKPYSADRNHVFYDKQSFCDKPERFKFVQNEDEFSTDGETIFYGAKALFPDALDAATFERIGSSDFYRDKNRVYTLEKIIEGADPKTFESIAFRKTYGSDKDLTYARDNQNIFYDGVKVESCDPKTHRIIDFTKHRDARHVFIRTEKISDDAANFKALEANYSKDSKNVFWDFNRIEGANAATFKVFESTFGHGFGTDGKNIYWCALKFERADVATFVGLTGHYGKDKNYVWYAQNPGEQPEIVENADAATFEIISIAADEGQDKNSIFRNGKFWAAR